MEFFKFGENKRFGRVRQEVLVVLEDKYQRWNKESKYDYLPFHNQLHTIGVERRAVQIAECIGFEDIELVRLCALFHDIVQDYEVKQCGVFLKRSRKTGYNEKESFDVFIEYITQYYSEYFERIDEIKSAFLATIPSFKQDQVLQKNLTPESPLLARILAMADLGSAGMESAEVFFSEGCVLFREGYLDLYGAGIDDFYDEFIRAMIGSMHNWLKGQISFIKSRKEIFEDDIKIFDDIIKGELTKLFSNFDVNLKYIFGKKEEFESLTGNYQNQTGRDLKNTFEQALKFFGYRVLEGYVVPF